MSAARSKKRVTLQDIAISTGYSVNTVSHALRNKEDISRETCRKIQQAARDMGYMGNELASSLRSGQTNTIAVIMGNLSNPFYSILTDIIQIQAAQNDYRLLIMCSRDQARQEMELAEAAVARRADGILLFPTEDSGKTVERLCQMNIPFVLMFRALENLRADSVVCDEEEGGYLAARHLLDSGCRKLAYLARHRIVYSYQKRLDGFLRACREAGLGEDEALFYCGQADPATTWQAKTTQTLISWREKGVDGIFVFCDVEAWQVQFLLQQAPELRDWDVGVVGFDNIQGVHIFPGALCSVDYDFEGAVRKALDMLYAQIRGETLPERTLVCPVRMVCRGSCRPGRHAIWPPAGGF